MSREFAWLKARTELIIQCHLAFHPRRPWMFCGLETFTICWPDHHRPNLLTRLLNVIILMQITPGKLFRFTFQASKSYQHLLSEFSFIIRSNSANTLSRAHRGNSTSTLFLFVRASPECCPQLLFPNALMSGLLAGTWLSSHPTEYWSRPEPYWLLVIAQDKHRPFAIAVVGIVTRIY